MKRFMMTVAATLLAAVPATVGLVGNTSFAQSVPVRVPSHAVVVEDTASQSRHRVEAPRKADDKGGLTKHAEPGDDRVSESGPGKDGKGGHGGDRSGKGGKDEDAGHQ